MARANTGSKLAGLLGVALSAFLLGCDGSNGGGTASGANGANRYVCPAISSSASRFVIGSKIGDTSSGAAFASCPSKMKKPLSTSVAPAATASYSSCAKPQVATRMSSRSGPSAP